MNSIDYYSQKLETITAIPEDRISQPGSIPVYVYLQEAEDLHTWCQPDREKLTSNGLDWALVDDLPARIDTLREAQARWENSDINDIEVEKIWDEKAPEALDLRQDLVRSMKFVFNETPSRISKIEKFSDGFSFSAVIQSLRGLAVFGREHIEELKASTFDITKIDKAEEMSRELGAILGTVHSKRAFCSDVMKIRDQAYTHLKDALNEIKRHADFVLWREPGRLKGYASTYNRRRYQKSKKNKNGDENGIDVTGN